MRQDQLMTLAQAIYEARFEGWPPRTVTPFAELSDEAREVWLRCARAAGEVETKRCARKARMHAHHALWCGLLPHSWDEATEQFGRRLAGRIETSILDSMRER